MDEMLYNNVLVAFLESDNKFATLVEMYDGYSEDQHESINVIFRMMTSYVFGDFNEDHVETFLIEWFELIQDKSVQILINKWSEYLYNLIQNNNDEKNNVFKLLNKLLKTIRQMQSTQQDKNFPIIITQKIWECKCFINVIEMFPEQTCGNNYIFNSMFCSLFTMKSWEINFNSYMDALIPMIQEPSIHNFLVNYIHIFVTTNIAYTYEDINLIKGKKCSPLNFNMFILKILIKIIEYYSLETIVNNIQNCTESYIANTEDISNLPFFHKLYFVTLSAIPVCHTSIFRQYDEIKSKLRYSLFTSAKTKSLLKEDLLRYGKLISEKSEYSINKTIQELYLLYPKIATKIENPALFTDIITYIDNITNFTQVENFYGTVDKEFYNLLSNISGGNSGNSGHDGLIKNVHIRYYACAEIFKLLGAEGFDSFENLYENLFKYISEVDFFEWTAIDVSIEHQYKLVETIYFLTDQYNHEIVSTKNIVAETLYVLLKASIKLFDLIHEVCEYYRSKNLLISRDTSLFQKMIDTIGMTLQIHQNVYEKNIIKIVYPEVEQKYSILVYELLTASTNIHHDLYTILRRPDLAASITDTVYNSISHHIDFCSSYLVTIKDTIIDNLLIYSKLPKNRKDYIINKLNEFKKCIDYPQEFLDPLLCTEIIDPIKIPEIDNEIFDRSSILTHIYDSKENPYTRKPLTVEILEEHNKQESVMKDINDFLVRKREFEMSWNSTQTDST